MMGTAEGHQQHGTDGAVLSLPRRSSTALYTSELVQVGLASREACAPLDAIPGLPAQICLLLMFLAPAFTPSTDAHAQI